MKAARIQGKRKKIVLVGKRLAAERGEGDESREHGGLFADVLNAGRSGNELKRERKSGR